MATACSRKGEQGVPWRQRFGGSWRTSSRRPANMNNSYTDEDVVLRRAGSVLSDLGVRASATSTRRTTNGWQQVNELRPFRRLQRAGDGDRSGSPTTSMGNGGRPSLLQGFNLEHRRSRGSSSQVDDQHRLTTRAPTRRSSSRPTSATRSAGRHSLRSRTRGRPSSATTTSTTASAPPSRTSRSSAASRPTRTRRPKTTSATGTAS